MRRFLAFLILLASPSLFGAPPQSPVLVEVVGQGPVHLLAAQPYLTSQDYRTPESFLSALSDFLKLAQEEGLLNDQTLVVFPELIGLYLYFMDERDGIYEEANLFLAGAAMVKARILSPRRAFGFLAAPPFLLKGRTMDFGALFYRKLLSTKAAQVAEVYQQTFSELARRYRVTMVAGSVPLPSPSVTAAGELAVIPGGEMENISAVFDSTGAMDHQLTVKAFPTEMEEQDLFTSRRSVSDLPVYDLPFGRLGVAICADSWYPQTYDHFVSKGANILAVPAFLAGESTGNHVWGGYNFASGISAPEDVDERDLGWLTEWQAWHKYALPGRLPQEITAGVTSFMKGDLWGDLFFGSPFLMDRGQFTSFPSRQDVGSLVLLKTTL